MKALPTHRPDRLLAASQGSRCQTGERLLRAHLNSPTASVDLPRAFREERGLGSKDRKIAQDAIYTVARHQERFLFALGKNGPIDDPVPGLWQAALVYLGLPPEQGSARAGVPLPGPAPLLVDPLDQLAMASSLPRWLLKRSENPQAMVDGVASRAPTCLRVNTAKTTREKLKQGLEEEGIQTHIGQWSPLALVLEGRANLLGSRLYNQGHFELQDEGSQLLAALVHPIGRSIDWCAGAGGKTLALLPELPEGGTLLAMDTRIGALQQAQKRAKRAGFTLAIRKHGQPPHPAERILVDAPCTGLGTLRRDPCLRWRLSPQSLDGVVHAQTQILDNAADCTKPGGRLVYATCSVLPEENQGQVQAFLQRHKGWRVLPAAPLLPPSAAALCQGDFYKPQPHLHGTDGFFAAVLQSPG